MNPIKILLVDDQSLFREGLRTLLSVQPEFDVMGEASNGEEALRLVAQLRPNIVLMDLRMPVMDGVTATRRLRELFPECKVIVLTTFDDDEDIFEGMRAGGVISAKLLRAQRSQHWIVRKSVPAATTAAARRGQSCRSK